MSLGTRGRPTERRSHNLKRNNDGSESLVNSHTKFKTENLVASFPRCGVSRCSSWAAVGLRSSAQDFTPECQTLAQGRSASAGGGVAWGEEPGAAQRARPSQARLSCTASLSPDPRPRARPCTPYLRRPWPIGSSRPGSRRPPIRSAAATSRPPLSRCARATAHARPAPTPALLESVRRVLLAAPRGEAFRCLGGSGEVDPRCRGVTCDAHASPS